MTVSSPVFVNKTKTNKCVVPLDSVFLMIIKAGLEVIFMNTTHLSSVMKCWKFIGYNLQHATLPRVNAQSSNEHSKNCSDLPLNWDFKDKAMSWLFKAFLMPLSEYKISGFVHGTCRPMNKGIWFTEVLSIILSSLGADTVYVNEKALQVPSTHISCAPTPFAQKEHDTTVRHEQSIVSMSYYVWCLVVLCTISVKLSTTTATLTFF